jgi:hypothetical protein
MNPRSTLQALVYTGLLSAWSFSAQAVTDEEFNELKARFEQLADAFEENASANTSSKTSIGGYGELHYNNLEDGNDTKKKEFDFHRFVLFFNHEFSDSIRLFSELELEHALVVDNNDGSGDEAPGEVELEQAYIEFDVTDNAQVKGGVFLIPVGILNETHEPPTFYGVERNPVEKDIIPSTWWEAGVMTSAQMASGLSFDVALSSGLEVDATTIDIRGGRQKVAKATGNNLAITGRIKYTGISGLELAATGHVQNDITQDGTDDVESAELIETHVIWNSGPVTAKALFAQWDIDGAGASAAEKDTQDGGYIEGGYKITSQFGVFARYNVWDKGGAGDTERTQTDVGINYWPHEDVVVKFDIQAQDHGDAIAKSDEKDGFNLGIGYQF